MGTLQIYLFGVVEIRRADHPEPITLTRTSASLLAYLVVNRGRAHSRESLTTRFWGDLPEDRARGCLNTAVWRLRRVLEPVAGRGRFVRSNTSGDIWFDADGDFWLDADVFESALTHERRPAANGDPVDAGRVEQTLRLYRGDLLEGIFDDWATIERERFRRLYVDGLLLLMHAHRAGGALEQSLACGERILHLDPLREDVHRDMMSIYLDSGRRSLALQQYDACRSVLSSELGIKPMAQTQALRGRVISLESTGGHQREEIVPDLDALHLRVSRLTTTLKAALRDLEDIRRVLDGMESSASTKAGEIGVTRR